MVAACKWPLRQVSLYEQQMQRSLHVLFFSTIFLYVLNFDTDYIHTIHMKLLWLDSVAKSAT